MNTQLAGSWTRDRILEVLGCRVAMSRRPSPIAALVLARLEGSK
jgi:hypothetical protein